jgi:hypothetical protein
MYEGEFQWYVYMHDVCVYVLHEGQDVCVWHVRVRCVCMYVKCGCWVYVGVCICVVDWCMRVYVSVCV